MATRTEPMTKKTKRRKDKMQGNFALLVVFSLSVIVLAIVASITLTQRELSKPKPSENPAIQAVIEELAPPKEDAAQAQAALEEAMNFWPSKEFPSVPQYNAGKYKTTVENMYANIIIRAEDAGNLLNYVDSLAESGAAVHVKTDTLIVLMQAGTEIQIRPTGAKPSITLCGEPQIVWENAAYADLILPSSGKLVSVQPGDKAGSLVFTYRNAAITDAMQYLNDLKQNGWSNTRRLSLKNNTLLAYYKKGDLQLTIDYFTGGNYQIILNADPSDADGEPNDNLFDADLQENETFDESADTVGDDVLGGEGEDMTGDEPTGWDDVDMDEGQPLDIDPAYGDTPDA